MRYLQWTGKVVLPAAILFLSLAFSDAQEKVPPGVPTAKVVVAKVSSGMVVPQSGFVGTVYYQEVSDVASEVDGLVETVNFEEGRKIEKGETLVKLNADLLQKTIQAAQASYEKVIVDIEKAKIDLQRIERLYREGLAPEQEYDEHRFNVLGKEKMAESLKAEMERLEAGLVRKVIKAPISGVILQRRADIGEWLSPGSPVVTIAGSDVVDIVVNVPEEVLRFIVPGQTVRVESGGREITGEVFTVIPKGDIATRTFPVKIRVQNNRYLMEGMDAKVILPIGKKRRSLIVPRDAVITIPGNTVVFAVTDSKAATIPVKVTGYDGMSAWVNSDILFDGMKVVIKGNERLRDGQPVEILMRQ
ncbi:MAG: efflux RND transporter periplasmic adaptor subunit [Nitrospirae bacterium]|nr:efflux RND transporter periplasmic adaptor subunit [Nitrospirota bacterium]